MSLTAQWSSVQVRLSSPSDIEIVFAGDARENLPTQDGDDEAH